jgi:O-acetylhomoserine (thiol)-lyase
MVLHAGPPSDLTTGAVAVPIFQTTSYEFRSTEHAANLFALKEFGNIYSRIMNSSCDTLEQKMAALEGGAAALPVSFGQAPSALAIQSLCRPGDNTVSSTDLYGAPGICSPTRSPRWSSQHASPTRRTRSRSGGPPTTAPVPTTPKTLPNPKLTAFPIGGVAATRCELRVPLIKDNTAAPPI